MALELDWKFTQSFGEKDNAADVTDGDMVTAVEFDSSGDILGVGDKAGRIWLFEGQCGSSTSQSSPKRLASNFSGTNTISSMKTSYINSTPGSRKFDPLEYKFHYQFQSHDPDFDCLKSLEIEEKINMIRFVPFHQHHSILLLSSNVLDKTVKLWKVYDKELKKVASMNVSRDDTTHLITKKPKSLADLHMPSLISYETISTAQNRNSYQNAHAYHINSISVNSDGETFISADDLRVNLWNLEISNSCFNIIDIKPNNMDELTEVITGSAFHPSQCNILMYSSSRGSIRLGDLRDSALCDQHSKLFEIEEDPATKSFFSEIVSSISDVKFSADGQFIISRDYLTLKVWDIRMETYPVLTVPIHDFLRPKLSDLYENDCIFDKFECAVSGDGNRFLTGSYSDHFLIYDNTTKSHTMVEASKPPARKPATPAPKVVSRKESESVAPPTLPPSLDVNNLSFDKKIMHVAWHPSTNAIAVAGLNNLYLYQA